MDRMRLLRAWIFGLAATAALYPQMANTQEVAVRQEAAPAGAAPVETQTTLLVVPTEQNALGGGVHLVELAK